MKNKLLVLSLSLFLSIILAGCNYPGRITPTTQVDMLNTAAAQTIQANQTQIADTQQDSDIAETPTFTPEPAADSDKPTTTEDPSPTITPTPTQTVKVSCDQSVFVSETIPDGTAFKPGQTFTKTWTLENTGSCTWNENYHVVFVEGDAMNAPAAKQLISGTVSPGQTTTISLDLQAPVSAGTHRGVFKLRNANGVLFGTGDNNKSFWVEIEVEGTLYNFTKNACASGVIWSSGAGNLPCPGSGGDSAGWIRIIDKPVLENGVEDDEPGLQVHPEIVNDGWIRGTFPEISITGGVYFRSIIGCYGSNDCDVKFKLNYKIDGGAEQTLATWHEVQDGKFNRVKVDLSSLAGEKVQFILLVEANGSSANDKALWFGPRIGP